MLSSLIDTAVTLIALFLMWFCASRTLRLKRKVRKEEDGPKVRREQIVIKVGFDEEYNPYGTTEDVA
jgi:hypothetical protein